MTRFLRLFCTCLLLLNGTHAFSTKKAERKGGNPLASTVLKSSKPFIQEPDSHASAAAFVHSAVGQYVVTEEEESVSTGTAAIACLLTMAVGFGLGYGT